MKKLMLVVVAFLICTSINSQTYNASFTKSETLEGLRTCNTLIIQNNKSLIETKNKLQTNSMFILNPELMSIMNEAIMTTYLTVIVYSTLFAMAEVEDFELNTELENLSNLIDVQQSIYSDVEQLHYNNLNTSYSNSYNYEELFGQAVDMFLGVPFFNILGTLNQKY